MRRRALLASALTVVSTATAGCGSVGRTEHTDPAVETDDDPQSPRKYLVFGPEDDDLATLGVYPAHDPLPRNFGTSISHRDGTELRSLTQRFAAPDGDGAAPTVALQGPLMGDHPPHPSVSLYRDRDTAVVEVHRFGELADETVFLDLPVTEWPASARRLVVENTVELVETEPVERTHVLEGRLEFQFTAATDGGSTGTPASG